MEVDNSPFRGSQPPREWVGGAATTAERSLASVLERLEHDEERVARIIAEALRKEIREYEAFAGADQFQVVVDDTRHHLRTFVRCALHGRLPDQEELGFIADLARLRAAAGFPLEAMLHAFRIGHGVLWDWIVAEADDGHKGEVALRLTPFMHDYLGRVTRRLTESYIESIQTSLADADKNRRDLLDALLQGEEPERLRPLAQAVGLRADAEYVVVVATVGAADPASVNEVLRRAEEVIRRHLVDAGAVAFPILRASEVVLLVPWATDHRRALQGAVATATASMAQTYGARLAAGGSMACDGFSEISRGYHEARMAMERAAATGSFVVLADAPLYEALLVLGAPSLQRRLPLWARDLANESAAVRDDLIGTLLAYVAADLRIEHAARELFVHPNTVRYRLRRLSRLTGLDITRFYDLVELVTALRLLPGGSIVSSTSLGTNPLRTVLGGSPGDKERVGRWTIEAIT